MFNFLKKILNIEILKKEKNIKEINEKKEKNENKNSAGGKNQIIINGKKYNNISSGNLTISNNKVYVNGNLIENLNNREEKNIKIEIYGDKNFISVDCCENIKINGNVYNIKLTNGTITCDDVKNDVTITNGDIKANKIFGKCNVINGDIEC
ncbi:hypothetical protein [Fusobacterium polymorphum]|uniref:Uncharacterized protein n=1 Tax=Fusobacterium nucleatum subsp. polymorphum TaxID=76857 RepID=A0A2C6A4H4_FUSNP|nr:hypothetical protein [Fusobacterium polymorphum]PHI06610.1 hypothetical protein CBG54_05965 [Fusobacterium polymorphum]